MKKLTLALTAFALLLTLAGPAAAALRQWEGIPSRGGASGRAIIDHKSSGTFATDASGRVQVNPGGGCARIQYAPYAIAAADGSWNNLSLVCGSSTATQSWSDRHWLGYNGFKFRICKDGSCGTERYIRY